MLMLCALQGFASHLFGGELYYTYQSGNQYKVTLIIYGDCSGQAFPNLQGATPEVDVSNNGAAYTTLFLSQEGAGVEVSPVCPSQLNNTTCKGGSVPGVKRYIYSSFINLPFASTNWKFEFNGNMGITQAGRSNAMTNVVIPGTTGSVMILDATLNNTGGNNSSPYYSTIPTPFFCINVAQQYNQGAVDPDGDLLTFSLVPGLEPGGVNVTYNPGYTATTPLATSPGGFSFSGVTGQLGFTPNLVQTSLVVGKVSEYRNGILVGTSMREMTFVVLNNCNNNPPTGIISGINGGQGINNYSVKICQNQILSFNVNPTDPDPGNTITVTAAGLPAGAVFNVANNGTSAPSASFSWNTTGVTPGSYNFFLTFQDDGCPLSSKQTLAYTVVVNPLPNIVPVITDPALCYKKAVLTFTPAGNAPWVIDILQGTTVVKTINANGMVTDSLAPGTYTVRVTDVNTCTKDTTIIITPPPPFVPVLNIVKPTCVNSSDGSVTVVSVANGTPPYVYALNAGAFGSNPTFTGLAVGSYVLHFKDAKNCTYDTTFIVGPPPSVHAAVLAARPPCNFFSTGVLDISGYNGVAPYQYELNGGGYGPSGHFTGLASGNYNVHVKDSRGCILDTLVKLDDSLKVHAQVTITDVNCYGGNDGSMTVVPYGATAPYTSALGTAAAVPAPVNYPGLTAGTYVLHLKDVDQCYLDTTVIVKQPDSLKFSPVISHVVCYGQSNGSVQINASGGIAPYTYALGTGIYGGGSLFSGLAAGTYAFHIKDAHNCVKDTNITITQPDSVTLHAVLQQPLCYNGANGTITITTSGGTAPYTFAINGGTFGANPVFGSLTAGTYTLSVRDSRMCRKDSTVVLGQPDSISVKAQVKNSTCSTLANGAVRISSTGGTPGYTYAFDAGSYSPNPVLSPVAAGTHVFHTKDANGCIKDTTITIIDSVVVTITTGKTDAPCYNIPGGSITITGGGGLVPYSYGINNGPFGGTNPFTPLLAGTYVASVRDNNGCIASTNVTITQPTDVIPNATLTNPKCFGSADGTITLNPSGGTPGYTYAMNYGTYGISNSFTGLIDSVYLIHVKDTNGCIHDTSVALYQPSKVVVTTLTGVNLKCYQSGDGSIRIAGSGGTPPYQYALNNGTPVASGTFNSLAAGTYTLSIFDNNNCRLDTSFTLIEPGQLTFTGFSMSPATCSYSKDGSFQIFGSGSSIGYSYSIDNITFTSNNTFTGLAPGKYTIYMTDHKGCKRDTTVEVTSKSKLNYTVDIKPASCYDKQDGSITVKSTGGVYPLTYHMEFNLEPDSIFQNLRAAAYNVRVTDNLGCRKDTNVMVTQPDLLKVKVEEKRIDCEGPDDDGAATAIAAGGTAPYAYYWYTNPTQQTEVLRAYAPGKYPLLVVDANGCRDSIMTDLGFGDCCKVYLPNAFSPNKDQVNDIFRIVPKGAFELREFAIYNRLGEQVFITNTLSKGWDGKFKGEDAPVATYYYYIKGKCGFGRNVEYKGDVTLLR